jgi:hypothetical protein
MDILLALIQRPGETETGTGIDLEFVVMDEEEFERPYRVIIHNDNVTTFEFVINTLVTIFQLSLRRNGLPLKLTTGATLMSVPFPWRRPRAVSLRPSLPPGKRVFP